jgi:P-type Mg2+ transporter
VSTDLQTPPSVTPQLGQGLTQREAAERLRRYGPNEPVTTQRRSPLVHFLLLFTDPLALLLIGASIVAALLGEHANATIIIVMVVLSVVINFIQTFRSQRVLDRLRGQTALQANVLRDGEWQTLPRRLVVPDDLVRLEGGDLVPADGDLIQSKDLYVQEASLTGESLPVEKLALEPASTQAAADSNRVFLGTSVVSGHAIARVIRTGQATAFGGIAGRLSHRPPETEFERGMRTFGVLITRTVVVLVVFVFVVTAIFRHDVIESMLFAVALAVGLTPELMPMITTVTLAQGALRMSKRDVIVKNLSAIQNLGSIDVLCSDKTGTLTAGTMQLERHVDCEGHSSERVFHLACLNSAFETGITNPLDSALKTIQRLPPLDAAILQHGPIELRGYTKVDEIPFDFERRRISIVADYGQQRLMITKGAPELVMERCSTFEADGGTQPFDGPSHARILERYTELSALGLRTLAVASRAVPIQPSYAAADEHDLVLAGFVAFADPVVADARGALHALKIEGVETKILTGDNQLVARHVCEQVGLNVSTMLSGDEVAGTSDAALGQVAEATQVFFRVTPAQKNRIIHALKNRGRVVGFLGDGINDAPSLHAADVGISVADAVDVAKDAADIILTKPGLRVLHSGIVEGRRAFGNVMKYILMGTSSNFGNMLSMAAAATVLPFLPMLPGQILLNNLLYDVSQVSIPSDNVDRAFLVKPRRWDMRLVRNFMLGMGPISSIFDFLTFYLLLKLLHADEALFHTGWFVESLITQTLVLFVIRTSGNPLKSRPSAFLTFTIVGIVVIGVWLPFSPVAHALGFVRPNASLLGMIFILATVYLALVQLAKRTLLRRVFA